MGVGHERSVPCSSFTASSDQLAGARAFVEEYVGCLPRHENLLGDVQLAVSEAVTNAIMHAFPDRPYGTGRVRLRMETEGDQLLITVTDDGVGMRERTDSPGAGYGRLLISRVSEATTESGPTGTTVSMRFALRSPQPTQG